MALDRQDQAALHAAHLPTNPTLLAARHFATLRAVPSDTLHAAAARAILERLERPTFYQGPPLLAGPRRDFGPGMRLDPGGVPYGIDGAPPLGWDMPDPNHAGGAVPLPNFVPRSGIYPRLLPNPPLTGQRAPITI